LSAVVRSATKGDVAAILELWGVARTAAAVTEDTPEAVTALIEHDPDGLLVAELDGRVVGALVAAWDGWRGNVYRLAVLPEHRRQGIGRALAEEGHRRLRERGARRITALLGAEDQVARAFWESAGYDDDVKVRRYVRNLPPA
jgi:ribosomal protein S18 acetylase RimI-like enzyme